MNPTIHQIKPDLVDLSELRPGDCFERPAIKGWVCMLTDHPTGKSNEFYVVVLNSGEVFTTKKDERVYPLKTQSVEMQYDFEREFEKERQD